jgi:hypothetical protein
MHTRRLVTLILGLWIGLTFAMFFVATQNFRGVDRLLEAPVKDAAMTVQTLGKGPSRMFLRHQVSELNRFYFEWFSIAQIALAILLGLALLFSTNGNKVMMGVALSITLLVVFQKIWLVPEITFLGRSIDFVPADEASPARSRFGSFHAAYSTSEVIKLLMLAGIAVKMLTKSPPRRSRLSRSTDSEDETVEMQG